MRPAREGDVPVRVKNSYNPKAPGTLINRTRDMSEVSIKQGYLMAAILACFTLTDNFLLDQIQVLLTSIVLKRNVTMLDIVSTRMLGQFGFLAKVRLHIFCTTDFFTCVICLLGDSFSMWVICSCTCRCFQYLRIWVFLWMLLPLVK